MAFQNWMTHTPQELETFDSAMKHFRWLSRFHSLSLEKKPFFAQMLLQARAGVDDVNPGMPADVPREMASLVEFSIKTRGVLSLALDKSSMAFSAGLSRSMKGFILSRNSFKISWSSLLHITMF
eukprot:CAMPEP_0197899544 /NCGR_PEP_ID=MMETSP1439-20131203/46760_1 /TAXON_ID=66791 /ORGANISM="Gonyaulax spinifera, Strain CCMP409" /LENGTH=123 /DNA_ID=CAMNT_0043520355 /DNA_START=246 /DNA_END=617 /DNA_ORIENTATION=-